MYDDQRHQSEPNAPSKEPFGKRFTRLIGILSSLLVVGFLAYWAYGLGKRDASEVPVIAALDGEARTAPEGEQNDGSDYEGLEVNSVLEGETPEPSNDVNLAPNPDDISNIEPAQSADDADASAAEDAPEALVENDENVELVANTSLTLPVPVRRPELLYVPQDDATPAVNAPAATNESAETQNATNEDATAEEIATDLALDASQDEAPSNTQTAANNASEQTSVAAGTPLIQLAANPDPDTTRRQWGELQSQNKDLLGDKSLYIEKAVVNGKTYYRLRVLGFANSEETRAACATLMARNVQCLAVVSN